MENNQKLWLKDQKKDNRFQPYKKRVKPYLIGGGFLAFVGWCLGNFFENLPGYDISERFNFLFSSGLETYINKNFFRFLFSFSFLAMALAGLGFIIALLVFVSGNDSGTYRHGEEHGSARYAKPKEILRFSDPDEQNNKILTYHAHMGLHNKNLPQNAQTNKNDLVLGDTGAAKTLAYVMPNIMQMNATYIITDPKGLLIHETGQMLSQGGYKIKIFDLDKLSNTDTFNVFAYIKTELDIDRVLEAITEGTKKSDNQGEDFWIKAEALLIRSFIAFLWFDGRDNDYLPNLSMVADMLRLVERQNSKKPSPVEEWFDELEGLHPDNYATRQWRLFNQLFKSETRASVFAVAAGRYSVFDHQQVRQMVTRDTMEIDTWGFEKTAVFIAIPETNDAYNFLSAIFFATAAEVLRSQRDAVFQGQLQIPAGKELLHIRFLLDEFANIGRIPNVEKFLATFRSREMSLSIIVQALDQVKTMYKNGWASIVNNCASLLFLGGEEESTVKYLSARADKQTLSIRNQSISKGGRGGGSENRQKQGRDLLTPGEIGRLPGDQCLLFITRQNVFRDEKYFAFRHPRAAEIANDPADATWYHYQRYFDENEELLAQVNAGEVLDHGSIAS